MLTGKVDNKDRLRSGLDSPKKVVVYSMGMRQRLGIAQPITEDPENAKSILWLEESKETRDFVA